MMKRVPREAIERWQNSMQKRYGALEERKIELTTEAEYDALPSPILKFAAVMCEIAPLKALIEGRDDIRELIEAGMEVDGASIDELKQVLEFHERAIEKRVQ